VRGFEEGCMQHPSIALEAVAQGRKRPVGVHPLAQVTEDLLAGIVPVQRLQLGPLHRLGLADEGEDSFGKDRALAVEALAYDRRVTVLQKVRFDYGLEGAFGVSVRIHG
jgi:hypothetical protein